MALVFIVFTHEVQMYSFFSSVFLSFQYLAVAAVSGGQSKAGSIQCVLGMVIEFLPASCICSIFSNSKPSL